MLRPISLFLLMLLIFANRGDDLRVLIGQFTTYGMDSQIYGIINLQGTQGNFETFVARDQYFGWLVPAPATIGLLGIACFFYERRR